MKNKEIIKTEMLLNKIKEQLQTLSIDGNWNYDSYSLGVYNGLERAVAILEQRNPNYRNESMLLHKEKVECVRIHDENKEIMRQCLQNVLKKSEIDDWNKMPYIVREFLKKIMMKCSHITHGGEKNREHYADIIEYSVLMLKEVVYL